MSDRGKTYSVQRGKTYSVRCKCANCGHEGNLSITKGQPAPNGGLGGHKETCPNCGCRTFMRIVR